jgi:hypothetical protein
VRIAANPAKGFYSPYFLFIPTQISHEEPQPGFCITLVPAFPRQTAHAGVPDVYTRPLARSHDGVYWHAMVDARPTATYRELVRNKLAPRFLHSESLNRRGRMVQEFAVSRGKTVEGLDPQCVAMMSRRIEWLERRRFHRGRRPRHMIPGRPI